MTQDEIIEMARQAGFTQPEGETWYEAFPQCIEAFAKLIAAKAIAELESQKPLIKNMILACPSYLHDYTHPPQRTEPKVCCQQYDTCLEPCTPRGTHLAQRTWVGLTDEEIKPCWYEACQTDLELTSQLVVYFAKAIEAKLKQKNGFSEEKNT